MDIGGIVKGLRAQKGYSMGKLSHRSGVANSAICRWESGESMPRVDLLQKVLNAMGYTLKIEKMEG